MGDKKQALALLAGAAAVLVAGGVAGWMAVTPGPAEPASDGRSAAQTRSIAQADQQAAPADPASTISDPLVSAASADGAVAFADDSLSFVASFPPAEPGDPVLAELRQEAERYLASTKGNARADFDRLTRSGDEPRPWDVRIRWRYTAKAGDLVSLAGEANEYTGGAHPMQQFDTHIARTSGEDLDVGDMLLPNRVPSPALTIGICEALKTGKQARIKSATIFDEPIACIGPEANAKTGEAKFALAPSDQPGKFGGIYAFYEPYVVGPYVEGSYVLTIQQGVFAQDLKPEFKALFGGEAPAWRD